MAKENNFRLKQVSDTLQLGKSGPILKKTGSALGIRNSTDAAYANLKAADPVGNNDYLTKAWATLNLGSQGGSYMGSLAVTDVQTLPSTIPVGSTYVYDKRSPSFLASQLRIAPANGHKILYQGRVIEGTGAAADGPELVINGTFNTNLSGWINLNGAFWDAGRMRVEGATGRQAEQGIPTQIGKRYKASVSFQNTTNPTIDAAHITIYGGPNATGAVVKSNLGAYGINNIGVIEFEFVAQTTTSYIYLSTQDGTDVVHYDNVSVKLAGTGYISLKNPWKGFALTGINSTTWALVSDASLDPDNYSIVGRNTWLNKVAYPSRVEPVNFALSGYGYIIGGGSQSQANLRYDDFANTYSPRELMPSGRQGSGGFIVDNFIHVAAGYTTTFTGILTRYNDILQVWATLTSDSVLREAPNGFNLNNLGYVTCGQNAAYLGTTTVYNPTTGAWSTVAVNPTIRSFASSFALDSFAYVAGGSNSGGNVSVNNQYTDFSNVWSLKKPLTLARYGAFGFELNGSGYIAGGFTTGIVNTASRYNIALNLWEDSVPLGSVNYVGSSYNLNGYAYANNGSDGTFHQQYN